MRTGSAGVATLRHAGLAALEALLIAVLVWFATMALAGAGPSGGLIASAQAGRDPASLTVGGGRFGGTTVAMATPGAAGTWIHATCAQAGAVVQSEWVRLNSSHRASLSLGPAPRWTSGAATCVAESGTFTAAGRWWIQSSATFSVTP
jgi:hypothetical protein